jgi:hypothetical protein
MFILESGAGIELRLSTSDVPHIYAIAGLAGQKVNIVEGVA